jgi:hypothetical protein
MMRARSDKAERKYQATLKALWGKSKRLSETDLQEESMRTPVCPSDAVYRGQFRSQELSQPVKRPNMAGDKSKGSELVELILQDAVFERPSNSRSAQSDKRPNRPGDKLIYDTAWRCQDCHHLYEDKVTECDCHQLPLPGSDEKDLSALPQRWEKLVIIPLKRFNSEISPLLPKGGRA